MSKKQSGAATQISPSLRPYVTTGTFVLGSVLHALFWLVSPDVLKAIFYWSATPFFLYGLAILLVLTYRMAVSSIKEALRAVPPYSGPLTLLTAAQVSKLFAA